MIFLYIALGIAALIAIGFAILELDFRGHRSARYLVPLLLSAVLIAVMVGINRGLWWTTSFFSTEALGGFLAGCIFMGVLYGLICWIDPTSRPRGSRSTADE